MAFRAIRVANELDDDRVADTLSDPVRRRVLGALRDAGTPIALADLARELARWETDDCVGELGWERVRQYHVSLYHCHVPKLAAAGLVEYDTDERTVAPVELPAAVAAEM